LEDEIAILRQCREGLEGVLGKTLEPLLTQSEIKACLLRVDRMLRNAVFPEPSPNWPAVPWPAF
jgi:hypothetical protein